MKRMKRIIAVYLVVVMCSIPFGTVILAADMSEDVQTQKVNDKNVEVEGNDSIGNMIATAISSEQKQSQDVNSVTGLVIIGNTASVTVQVQTEADVVIAIYDEKQIQMLASGKITIEPGEDTVQVKISENIPQYFIASVFLLDKKTHEALCDVYTTELYTKAVQDLKNSTVKDYDEEQVVQLDGDNETTNFAVYNKDTVAIDETTSDVQIINNGDGSYIIKNATNNLINMKKGDTVSYQYSDGTLLLVKIKDISVNGGTVTICEDAETDLNDYFDYVKIEADSSVGEYTVDDSNLESGVTPLGNSNEVWAKEARGGNSVSVNQGVAYEVSQAIGEVEIKGAFKFDYGISFEYYSSLEYKYLSLNVDYSTRVNIDITGKIPIKEIVLGRVSFSLLPCVNAGFTPAFVIEASGKMAWSGIVNGKIGGSYDSNRGFNSSSAFPSCKSEFKIEGTLFLGIKAEPYVSIISANLDKAVMDVSTGVEFSAQKQIFDTSEDVVHDCKLCIDGDVNAKASISMSIVFAKGKIKKIKTLLTGTGKISDFYYSSDYNEFRWTTCPHICYPVSVTVKDNGGNSVKGKSILTVTDKNTGNKIKIRMKNQSSDSVEIADSQKTKIYLPNGAYNIKAVLGSREGKSEVSVYDRGTETTVKLSNVNTYKNITWWVENNDTLYIEGFGNMPDYEKISGKYSMRTNAPWNPVNDEKMRIKKVVIDDGITSIGARAFASMFYLEEIVLPKSVVSIGTFSFFDCAKLVSIDIPEKVKKIESYAFSRCAKLQKINIPSSITELAEGIFHGCESLENIELPENISKIGGGSFDVCKKLKNIKIPKSVTEIGNQAFEGCSSLKTIEIPENVTVIGVYAFGMNNGQKIFFRGNKPQFGFYIFSGSENMTIYYPAYNSTWKDIETQNFGGTNIIWSQYLEYNSETGEITVPYAPEMSISNNNEIAVIEESGSDEKNFDVEKSSESENADNEDNITWWVEDNDTLHIQGNGNMSDYSTSQNAPWTKNTAIEEENIKKVIVEKGVTSIGSYAFSGLDSLEEVRISEDVKLVGNNIFGADSAKIVYFAGNKPEFSQNTFSGTADVIIYYPENATWNDMELENFGGASIKWLSYAMGTVSEIQEDITENEFSSEDDSIVEDETEQEGEDFSSGDFDSFDEEDPESEIQEFDAPISYAQDNVQSQGQSITFSKRVPYSNQIFVVVKNNAVEDIFESSNLLYIKQENANDEGIVSFKYILKENYTNPVTGIYGAQIKDVNELQITLSFAESVYSGYAQKPSMKVVDGSYVLKNGADYVLSYLKNIDAGKAVVKITGKGKYAGQKQMYFTIKQANCSLQFKYANVTKKYGSSAFTNPFKTKKTDGKLVYSSSNSKVARIDKNNGKVTIVGVGKTVIKVQANSGKNYKAGSATYVLNVTKGSNNSVQPKNVSNLKLTLSSTVYTYNGYAKKPTVKAVDGSYVLKNGTDYVLSYLKNIDAGKAVVKITGKGKYAGQKQMYFTIKQANCSLQFKYANVTKKYGSSAFTNPFKTKKTDGKLVYSSSNSKVARIDKNNGKVTIVGVGKTAIKVQANSGKNYKAGSVTYVLTVGRGNNVIKASNIMRRKSNGTQIVNIKISRRDGAKLTYKSNSKYVRVNSKGKIIISPKFVGKAVITISAAKTSKYNSASKKITVTVRKI